MVKPNYDLTLSLTPEIFYIALGPAMIAPAFSRKTNFLSSTNDLIQEGITKPDCFGIRRSKQETL